MTGAGVQQLSCRRTEARPISCQYSQTQFFGTVPGKTTAVQQLQAAQLTTETRSSDDGDYQLYSVRLVSPSAVVNVTAFDTDYLTKQNWVQQVNQFISSPQTELKLTRDTRWKSSTIAPILFSSLFIFVGIATLYGALRTRTLILDKALNRLTYRVQTLSGTKQLDYPLGVVTGIELKEHTDSYGNKFYEPILLPDTVRRITFAQTANRLEAFQLQEQVSQFLQLRVTPLTLPNSDQTILYQSQNRTYTTTNLTAIPATACSRTQETDLQLYRLGFSFVGDLKPSTLPITYYAYAQPNKSVYAVIMEADTGWLGLEFFSSFLSGTLLTTTSHKLVVKHLKAQKLTRWSYPSFDATQLYYQHHQHGLELQSQAGGMQRARAELTAVAALIDDYVSRQLSGGFATLGTMLNLFSILSGVRKAASQK